MMQKWKDLTNSQRYIAMEFVSGYTAIEIAKSLNKTPTFIENQIEFVRHNLGCKDVSQLIDFVENIQLANAYSTEEQKLSAIFVFTPEVKKIRRIDVWLPLSSNLKELLEQLSNGQDRSKLLDSYKLNHSLNDEEIQTQFQQVQMQLDCDSYESLISIVKKIVEWLQLSYSQRLVLEYLSQRNSIISICEKMTNHGHNLNSDQVNNLILEAKNLLSCNQTHLVDIANCCT